MRTYAQLTTAQQKKAVEQATNALLQAICEGVIKFNDALNGDNLQARIDAAWEKAESTQTPWFVGEYIMDTCKDEIEGMAQWDAEDAFYPDAAEHCIAGIA